MYTSSQCYMPCLVEIGPPVLDKIFRRFLKGFTLYGHGGHLGHVTWIIYVYIGSPTKRFQRSRSLKLWTTDGRWTAKDGRRSMAIL